jgi:hypothetical protein
MLKPRETEERRQELLGQKKIIPGFMEEKKIEPEKEEEQSAIHFKVRFDFKGKEKPAKFFFGGKNSDDVARYTREQQVALWRNVPVQGINIIKIEEEEVYDVFDETQDQEVAYAPLIMEIKVDSLEDLVRFVVREEFRRIDILEPKSVKMSSQALERLLFKFHQAARDQVFMQVKKFQE